MKFVLLAVLGAAAVSAIAIPEAQVRLANHKIQAGAEKLEGAELVDYLKKTQNFFTAELSSTSAQNPKNIKNRLMKLEYIRHPVDAKQDIVEPEITANIPSSFDSRTFWPQCPSLNSIRDQSSCGSCWAISAAEAMTDRICIFSNGTQQVKISADDLMSCCGFSCGYGCEGGYPISAWRYWAHHGIVTGGLYGSNEGCKPYPYAPCEHHTNGTHYKPCPAEIYPTPTCEKKCISGYSKTYNNDKHYGKSAYAVSSQVAAIQQEIMTNGPVEVTYEVYADFEHYTGGVYVHTGGELLGGHAVKMIGWGTDPSGVPYWLCSNSWNTDWGEKGFFRIVRGRDECGIESGVVGGIPKL